MPEGSTRLAAILLCLASNCPSEAVTQGPIQCLLSTELLIQQPVRPMALFALAFGKLCNMDQRPLAEEERVGIQAEGMGGHLPRSLGYTFPLGES